MLLLVPRYWPGPATVNPFLLDSFLPSPVQMAPVALQPVVTGSTMVKEPSESGVTWDLPPNIAGRLQPAHIGHRAPGHGQCMVPHSHVAEVRRQLIAEAQLEDERAAPVMGQRHVLGAGRQRRVNDRHRHRTRCGAGELLVAAGVVGEGYAHFDRFALLLLLLLLLLLISNKGVAGSGCPVDLSVVGQPLVGEGSVVEAVTVGYAGGVGGEGLPDLGRPTDGGQPDGRGIGKRRSRRHSRRPGAGELLVAVGCRR